MDKSRSSPVVDHESSMAGRDRLVIWIIRHRYWVIAFYALLGLAMAPGVLQIRQDNSPEIFFVRDAEALQQYEAFEFKFGRDRSLRVVLEGDGVWTREGLAWMAEFEREAYNIRGVVGAAGLYGHHGFRYDQWPPADPAALRKEVLADPLDHNAAWVNDDATMVTVLVGLYRLSPADQSQALADIERRLATLPANIDATMVGLPEVNRAMDAAFIDILFLFLPSLVLLSTTLLAVWLRQWAQVVLPLALVSLCLLVPTGMMGYLSVSFNLVLAILLPLLFVITLATAVHVLLCFRRFQGDGRGVAAAVEDTFRIKRWPVIWTGLTTGVGFGSFMLSAVPPIGDLGLWAMLSIAFMTLAVLTMYPALLACTRPVRTFDGLERHTEKLGERMAVWSVRQPRRVIMAFATSALLLFAATPLLRIESNVLTYFKDNHAMRIDLSRAQDRGIGVIAAELLLVRTGLDSDQPLAADSRFDSPAQLNRLADLADAIRSLPGVLGGISAADQVHGISRYRYPDDHRSETALLETLDYMRADSGKQQMLNFFLTAAADQARVSILVPMLGFNELEPVFAQAMDLAQDHFPDTRPLLTGQYPMVLAAQKTLLRTMLLSLSLTLLCIALIFRWVLGSTSLAFRAMLPNLWPVVFVLGIMGWSGVPLDSTTVMVAAAVLGLAVDDTLHSLGNFRVYAVRLDSAEAAVSALRQTAPAHVLTTLVLAAGFTAIGFSSFLPVARFGQLSALAVLTALLADLYLIPALLADCSPGALAKLSSYTRRNLTKPIDSRTAASNNNP